MNLCRPTRSIISGKLTTCLVTNLARAPPLVEPIACFRRQICLRLFCTIIPRGRCGLRGATAERIARSRCRTGIAKECVSLPRMGTRRAKHRTLVHASAASPQTGQNHALVCNAMRSATPHNNARCGKIAGPFRNKCDGTSAPPTEPCPVITNEFIVHPVTNCPQPIGTWRGQCYIPRWPGLGWPVHGSGPLRHPEGRSPAKRRLYNAPARTAGFHWHWPP